MTGVEILATQEVVTETVFSWPLFWMIFGVCIVLFAMGGIIAAILEADFEYLWLIVAGALFGTLFGCIVAVNVGEPTEYETQYKVTISDEVPMNEFLERYEIVSQEGKIYTVRERNGE